MSLKKEAAGKPEPKRNHFHIPANPDRLKAKELQERHTKRLNNSKPVEMTNEIIYELLMDVLAKQEVLERKLDNMMSGKPAVTPQWISRDGL